MVISMAGFYEVKRYILIAATVVCLTAILSSTSVAQEGLQKYSEELAAIAERVSPAVVSVFVEERDADPPRPEEFFKEWRRHGKQPFEFFKEWRWREGQPFDFFKEGWRFVPPSRSRRVTGERMGTGIIMDKEGHIVTASHIVDDPPDEIRVKLADRREFHAELVGADPDSGVAVVKIDAEDLTPIRSGDSDDVKVGELVLALSNLHRLGIAATIGIVSATRRTDLGITTYEDFIQTDAMVGPGSGGGPLVNARGEAIGMIIASHANGSDSMGTAFAVPINTVLEVMDDLVNEGKVKRGWLGVQIQDVSADLAEKMELAEPRGALVVRVSGPAEEGGIEAGDVIVEFDGKTIESTTHLRNIVAHTDPGKEVTATVMRKGEEKKLTVRVGERTEESAAALGERRSAPKEDGWMGITAQELTRELARKFGYEGEEGVLISHVREDSPAHEKGLQSGDLIQEVEGKSISSIQDYEEAIQAAGDSVLLRIKRGERVWYEVIKAEDR
jgi:serine protease Do